MNVGLGVVTALGMHSGPSHLDSVGITKEIRADCTKLELEHHGGGAAVREPLFVCFVCCCCYVASLRHCAARKQFCFT